MDYPDLSHHNWPISFHGAELVWYKATQGTGYIDPTYATARDMARSGGTRFAAYHWLDTSPAGDQAEHCFSVVGRGVPLMIDDEQNVISVQHTLMFVERYRELGGLVTAEYAPRHTWMNSGRPSLVPFREAGLILVASHYGDGPEASGGWVPYGNVAPAILQYTDAQPFNGKRVDFNRYHGTADELWSLITGAGMEPSTKLSNNVTVDTVLVAVYNTLPMLRTDDVRLNFLANTSGLVDTVKATLAAVTAEPTNDVNITDADIDALATRVITELATKLGAD